MQHYIDSLLHVKSRRFPGAGFPEIARKRGKKYGFCTIINKKFQMAAINPVDKIEEMHRIQIRFLYVL
jgi:hypothetical protein